MGICLVLGDGLGHLCSENWSSIGYFLLLTRDLRLARILCGTYITKAKRAMPKCLRHEFVWGFPNIPSGQFPQTPVIIKLHGNITWNTTYNTALLQLNSCNVPMQHFKDTMMIPIIISKKEGDHCNQASSSNVIDLWHKLLQILCPLLGATASLANHNHPWQIGAEWSHRRQVNTPQTEEAQSNLLKHCRKLDKMRNHDFKKENPIGAQIGHVSGESWPGKKKQENPKSAF